MLTDRVLSLITALLKTDNHHSCIQAFLKIANAVLIDGQCFFLQPDLEGRTFHAYSHNGLLNDEKDELFYLEIADFTHPFSHVVQSKKIKRIFNKEMVAWENNIKFKYLIYFFDLKSDQYEICPLYFLSSGNLAGMIFFSHSDLLFSNGFDPKIWSWLLSVFTIHLDQCAQHSKNIVIKNYLSESLKRTKDQALIQNKITYIKKTIIGESRPIIELINNIAKISSSMINILIMGQTGTGKELVARAIHETSDRKTGPFIAINCASIPEHLLESELFGYAKGAFTGADTNHKGLISSADKGVLFLDEVGDMPISIQAKLLRVIELKKYRPLGATQEEHSDFRLVAATHKDLKTLATNNLFRKDFYYRISQYLLCVPSLIKRTSDIPLLVDYFIRRSNFKNKTSVIGCADTALLFLKKQKLKGNVRELKNIIDIACMLTDSNILDRIHFEEHILSHHHHQEKRMLVAKTNTIHCDEIFYIDIVRNNGGLKEALNYIEKKIIEKYLEENQHQRKKTSELLGIPLRTLSYKCRMLNLLKRS